MTYTIKYTDILAFTKDSKKDHSATIDKIFQTVSRIKSKILFDKFIVIVFNADVKFVDPLFFILLFDLRHENKSTLVFDMRQMNDTSQHYAHRLLTQYSDLEQFESYSPYSNSEIYIPINIIEQSNVEHLEQEFKRFLKKEKIHLFTNVAHKKSLINDTQYEYSMLPIMRLRNFDLKSIDMTVHEDALKPYDKRRKFYNELSLNQPPKRYRENLHNKIEVLLEAVGLSTRGLSNSFRDIFFELIDNIRKHTPSQSNAHISFRRDKVSNLYKLIISDNSSKGFLNTYRETLKKEEQRLVKSGVKKELLGNYSDVIRDITNEKYEKVLKGLFEIQRTKSNTSDDEIHIHQIPRIAMHFGLPILIKLLEKLSEQSTKTKPELKIYLHNNNQYFEIKYSFNNQGEKYKFSVNTKSKHNKYKLSVNTKLKHNKYKFSVNTKSKHNKDGTYIIITFPEDVKLPAPEYDISDHTLTNLSFKNNDYKYFLDKRTKIQEQVNKFEFYEDKHIRDDLDDARTNHKCENKCAVIKYSGSSTFSDFLRNIYLYAYKHDVEDIVVINTPLYEYGKDRARKNQENTEHLKLLATILYGKEDSDPYETSLNILFYSDRDLSAILIGGRDQKEYCYLNQLLSSIDDQSHQSSICKKPKNLLPSNLFINFGEDKKSILPFELFDILDMDRRNSTAFSQDSDTFSILRDLIEMHLNEVAKRDDIHIDAGSGYHIDRYMEFKKIFEDSRWVRRLAFRLAMRLPVENETVKYYLYGTDKYTNMLISLCYTFLGLKDFKRFKYKLFNIYDDYDYSVIKEKIKETKNDGSFNIYLISSVIVGASKHIELINNRGIKAIPAIELNVGKEQHPKIKPLFTIENKGAVEKITDDRYCQVCVRQSNVVPLLELAKDDPFFIKDTFFEAQSKKSIVSYAQRKNIHIKWFDSLSFGHVERENNHFLYYINTIKFFNENRPKIKDFLFNYVKRKINYDEKKKEKIILLTSSHDTNNNFVSLVNQEVFDNDAIILSFNKLRGEANFHDLKSYEYFNWENTRVFFVDDSIASSHTLKYFYQLLRSVPNIMNKSNVRLDGVIVMIDRISSYDETILCSYLKDSKDVHKPNKDVQQEKLEALHVFSTFDIKPIKSEVEKCFLCTRKTKYSQLTKKSALDLTTFQMARRAYKLKKIPYREVTPAKEKSLEDRFKIYLKAMATNYIYEHYAHQENYKDFNKLLEKFSSEIYGDLVADKEDRFKKYQEDVLKKIIKFQAEIALLKALSFPKLSYYYGIREWAIETIFAKLKSEVFEIESKDFNLIYPLRDDIKNLDKDSFDNKDKKFLTFYKGMTNLHLINVYFATLGYFKHPRILDTDYIKLYHKITQNKDIKDRTLLHTYPFAVKFTIADNLEKANYFEKNLNKVFEDIDYLGNKSKKKYAHINALKIENTLYWKNYIEEKFDICIDSIFRELRAEDSMDVKMEQFTNLFQIIFVNLKVHLFVSPYATITPKSYGAYLKDSENELVNILDSFNSIGNYSESMMTSVKKVFYGAIDIIEHNEKDVVLEKVCTGNIYKTIDNTWANEYTDDYIVIRLTSVDTKLLEKNEDIKDNKPVWFRPIGCIVVEKQNTDYKLHLEVTRTVLSLKEYIVDYLSEEFGYGLIQEAIQKKKIEKEYQNVLSNINHSVKEYLNIEGISEHLIGDLGFANINTLKEHVEDIRTYSFGLRHLSSIAELKIEDSYKNNSVYKIFYLDGKQTVFLENLNNFLKVANKFLPSKFLKIEQDIEIIDNSKDKYLTFDLEYTKIEHLVFEVIFNALKCNIEEDYQKIQIEFIENGIKFRNKLQENDRDDAIKKINGTSEKKGGFGMETIRKMLDKHNGNYKMILDYDSRTKEIIIIIHRGDENVD